MTAPEIQIKFDGGDASKHVIDMIHQIFSVTLG